MVAHPAAAMHGQAVPDEQQPPGNLAAPVPQKLHRSAALDAAAKEAKVRRPQSFLCLVGADGKRGRGFSDGARTAGGGTLPPAMNKRCFLNLAALLLAPEP
jgi:hypothetical protein